jgi:hypothetical protein
MIVSVFPLLLFDGLRKTVTLPVVGDVGPEPRAPNAAPRPALALLLR